MKPGGGPPRLPGVGQSTQSLLDDYAKPLLSELRRIRAAEAIAARVEQAVRALENVLHARELCERLTLRADALAADAELVAEEQIRALFAALASDAGVQAAVFPEGLGASLAPRGQLQVSEIERLLAAVAKSPSTPLNAAAATARLAMAATTLLERCSAAARTQVALVDVSTAEQHQRRSFRTQCHEAYGAIIALLPNRRGKVARLFNRPEREGAGLGLPAAPPPTPRVGARLAPGKSKARKMDGRRAR